MTGERASRERGRAPCGAPPSPASTPRGRAHTSRPSSPTQAPVPAPRSRPYRACSPKHAPPISVLESPPSRGAALSVSWDRSSLPPSAHRMRRGSPRAVRSRIRVDDRWLGATRQSFILAICTKVWSIVLCLCTRLRDIYTHEKNMHTALSAAECTGFQACRTSRPMPARPCHCASCPRRWAPDGAQRPSCLQYWP